MQGHQARWRVFARRSSLSHPFLSAVQRKSFIAQALTVMFGKIVRIIAVSSRSDTASFIQIIETVSVQSAYLGKGGPFLLITGFFSSCSGETIVIGNITFGLFTFSVSQCVSILTCHKSWF